MPTPEVHARLSASSSARWLNCTPSVRLAEQFPNTTSEHAEAGRLAHAIAELKARKYFIEPMSARSFNAQLKKLKEDPRYDTGMDSATDGYLEHLKNLAMSFGNTPPFVALETRVDYSHLAHEGFGTADCIMIGAGRICVIDYKNGSGVPVAAEHNSQMMLYALGALRVYAPIYGSTIQEVILSIVQPHAGGVKEWRLTRTELEDWGENYVKPRAAMAFAGEGECCPGNWCKSSFCPARAQCRAYADYAAKLTFQPQTLPELLTDAEIGERLTLARRLATYTKIIEGYVEKALLAGKSIPGFKLVEGRGSREWKGGTDAAFEALKANGVSEALLWERKPVTPPSLEKALGKKTFEEAAAGLVDKLPGKPAIAPESDPRKPYSAAVMAFEKVDSGG